jgi:endonuclease III
MDKSRPFVNVHRVVELLSSEYKLSRFGNKSNPLDELAYVLLAIRTSEGKSQEVYEAFKQRFPRWSEVAEASLPDIAKVISQGGLARQKARVLRAIARKLRRDFGRVTLQPLHDYSTERAEEYLCSLPGVGIKTARIVLMYALDRPAFPADIHCLRIMARLGWIDSRAASYRESSEMAPHGDRLVSYVANSAQQGIPPKLRLPLHVFFVQHGRQICRTRPFCDDCVLREVCPQVGVS